MEKSRKFELSTTLQILGSLILLAIIVSYAAFQARFLITGPQIVLENEPETQQNVRVINLTGKAFNITRLWLNDRQIYTDEDGYFNEALVLENSYTISTLRATDRYGRETSVIRSFVYTPTSLIK